MIDVVLSRLVQGLLSGIGIGTIFYFYPIIRHMVSQKYRYKFRFNKGGIDAFKKETRKYFKLGLTYGFITDLQLELSLDHSGLLMDFNEI